MCVKQVIKTMFFDELLQSRYSGNQANQTSVRFEYIINL